MSPFFPRFKSHCSVSCQAQLPHSKTESAFTALGKEENFVGIERQIGEQKRIVGFESAPDKVVQHPDYATAKLTFKPVNYAFNESYTIKHTKKEETWTTQ